jgi:hypothetical protein
VFLSTPFDSHLDSRNNFFRRFSILISRVLTLIKSRFLVVCTGYGFCVVGRGGFVEASGGSSGGGFGGNVRL